MLAATGNYFHLMNLNLIFTFGLRRDSYGEGLICPVRMGRKVKRKEVNG
jgi:hypothetical protein